MSDNFLEGARAKCPHCGKDEFAPLAEAKPRDIVTCLGCGQSVTVEQALAAGIEEALIKQLAQDGSFKR